MPDRLFWRVFLPIAALLLVILAGVGFYSIGTIESTLARLGHDADITKSAIALFRSRIVIGAILGISLAALVALAVTRHITRSIDSMRQAVSGFASGDFTPEAPEHSPKELAALGRDMNNMARSLDNTIQGLARERSEQEASLASMVDGVLAVDAHKRVVTINRAAVEMLEIREADAVGRYVHEVTRNPQIQRFIDDAVQSRTALERQLNVHGDPLRIVQARGAKTLGTGEGDDGVVVVMHDVTMLNRLETMRRDFVANVSHELKTPITSIKGFIETLADGAIDDPEQSTRFLSIAARQADRLNTIIEDLLSLSRIERDTDDGTIELVRAHLLPVVQQAVEFCRHNADRKRIAIQLDCPNELEAAIDVTLLEQALINLIDNAIKYSDEEKVVRVVASKTANAITISVADEGAGIEERHLSRLFERFYRVDKARSRKLGGTGLGLAIVKHISAAHGGSVNVTSRIGEGSRFTISLPNNLTES